MSKEEKTEAQIHREEVWRLRGIKACATELKDYFQGAELELLEEIVDSAISRVPKPKPTTPIRIAKPWSKS